MFSRHHPASSRCASAISAVALCAAVVATSACAGVENLSGTTATTGTGTGGILGGGGAQTNVLLGRWTRAILVQGSDGIIHESRTTWEFRADHSAIRNVTAWNWTDGYYDTLSSVAQWTTSGSNITLVYIAGTSGTLTLDYRIDGDVLTMGPDQYARLK